MSLNPLNKDMYLVKFSMHDSGEWTAVDVVWKQLYPFHSRKVKHVNLNIAAILFWTFDQLKSNIPSVFSSILVSTWEKYSHS